MGIHDNLCCQALRLFSLNQHYIIFMTAKKTKTSANWWQRYLLFIIQSPKTYS